MKLIRYFLVSILLGILHTSGIVDAPQIEMFTPISSENIKVNASCEYPGLSADETINGSGFKNPFHLSHLLGKAMWVSGISKSPLKSNETAKICAI